jgi:hypothetical protein
MDREALSGIEIALDPWTCSSDEFAFQVGGKADRLEGDPRALANGSAVA